MKEKKQHGGDRLLDEFVIEKKLGTGGMGNVYLVRNQVTHEHFAVKSILPDQVNEPGGCK
jgi:serine/threonine protein kinase